MKISVCLVSLALSGCATMREHPVLTALAAGSIAAVAMAQNDSPQRNMRIPVDPCANPESCR